MSSAKDSFPRLPTTLWIIFPIIFLAVLAAHATLLRLPYYWDEAGYYIPAAFDFFRTGSLIPYSTLTNAHPPLPAIYLALWWKLFGFSPLITRTAMCFMSAVMLTAVWKIAFLTTRRSGVAFATVLLSGLYPIVFTQSSLAHADLTAATATLWAITFFLEDNRSGLWLAALCFSIAVLCKETAIVTPLALAAWGLVRHTKKLGAPSLDAETWDHRLRATTLLLPLLPLACWYLYHHHRTGYIFGNPEYLRYNAAATITPLRILLAFLHRLLHITAHMNLFVPVALMLACMLLEPLNEPDGSPRPRISIDHQLVFYVVIAANVLCFSVLGGALLTRYLLSLYPLILLLCVNTFRRRFAHWPGMVAFSAIAFVTGLFVNPPYRFAPEDNLAYANVIRLHQSAIAQITSHYPYDTVLTAWPATDELSKPELGYVTQPIKVTAIDNFSYAQIDQAAQRPETYSAALLFSTKYDPPHLLLSLGGKNEAVDKRFFDFHTDLAPGVAARLLHGEIAWQTQSKGQWAAVLRFNRQEEAKLSE